VLERARAAEFSVPELLYATSKPGNGECVSGILVSKVKDFLILLKVISFGCASHRQ